MIVFAVTADISIPLFGRMLWRASAAVGGSTPANPRPETREPAAGILTEGQDCTITQVQIDKFTAAYNAANAALDTANKANTATADDTTAINNALKTVTFDADMVGKFVSVASTLEAGVDKDPSRFKLLNDALSAFGSKKSSLDDADQPFKGCTETNAPNANVKTVLQNYALISAANDTLQGSVSKNLSDLKLAIKGIPDKVALFIGKTQSTGSDGLAGRIADLDKLPGVLLPQTIQRDLVTKLPVLLDVLVIRRTFQPVANRLADDLDPAAHKDLKDIISSKPTFAVSFNDVDTPLKSVISKLPDWADQVAAEARNNVGTAQDALSEAMRNLSQQSSVALPAATVADRAQQDHTKLFNALTSIISELQNSDIERLQILPPNFIAANGARLSGDLVTIQQMVAKLGVAVRQLNSNIPVDRSRWAMSTVDLFYFDNVGRLIQVLSPNAHLMGGAADLQAAARTARLSLLQAGQDLENADAAVSDSRTEVARRQEDLRLATLSAAEAQKAQDAKLAADKANADSLRSKSLTATTDRKKAEARQATAQSELDAANAAVTADPSQANKTARDNANQNLISAQRRVSKSKAVEDEAIAQSSDATTAATNDAQATNQELLDLKTSLTAGQNKLEAALTARQTATTNQRTALKDAFLKAEVDNFAYAQARDNAPFWTNVVVPSPAPAPAGGTQAITFPETDPIGRVLLFAFPDTRTIFIRGEKHDIEQVTQMIKEFDRPEGEAMMILRTIEISSDGTNKGVGKALKTLMVIDQKVTEAEQSVEREIRFLRDSIGKQVNVAVGVYKQTLEAKKKVLQNSSQTPQTAAQTAAVQNQLNTIQARINFAGIESIAFYDSGVINSLGWQDQNIDRLVDSKILEAMVPRPTRTLTLAQALVVLTMASRVNRQAILGDLKVEQKKFTGKGDPFGPLIEFIGDPDDSSDILAFQSWLVEALRFNGITHILKAAEEMVRGRMALAQEMGKIDKTSANEDQVLGLNARIKKADDSIDFLVGWLNTNTPTADPASLKASIQEAVQGPQGATGLIAHAVGLQSALRYRFPLATESAVNLTFRKFVEKINQGFNDAFVKPAFRTINETVLKEHLGTGIVQETSILASNRLGARVDPRGSAQLAVGEERNILEAARQLTNMFGSIGKGLVTNAASNPVGAAGTALPGGAALSTAQSVINGLDQQRRYNPAIYGISTGNLFEVTPIIDPSGQALRFRFDFLLATQIREPNDTIDPQLPRIERHSVNTEVHLANQEIRLVSQFQANSRLGLPERKWGGIPILNDIKYLNEVPLIGWFVRRGGRAAVTQQSLIFCQTMMYPTLGEVLDLLAETPTFAQ